MKILNLFLKTRSPKLFEMTSKSIRSLAKLCKKDKSLAREFLSFEQLYQVFQKKDLIMFNPKERAWFIQSLYEKISTSEQEQLYYDLLDHDERKSFVTKF